MPGCWPSEIEALVATTQGVGIGSALVDELCHRAGRVPIHVVTTNDNLPLLAFYQRRGFRLAE